MTPEEKLASNAGKGIGETTQISETGQIGG